mmetsp:Transcript_64083/g.143229  ORF Transcript_64083/g.143229 Transcript_64083/m.143229 type:complete len:437 (-) Transcript_64083:778-2088(-)
MTALLPSCVSSVISVVSSSCLVPSILSLCRSSSLSAPPPSYVPASSSSSTSSLVPAAPSLRCVPSSSSLSSSSMLSLLFQGAAQALASMAPLIDSSVCRSSPCSSLYRLTIPMSSASLALLFLDVVASSLSVPELLPCLSASLSPLLPCAPVCLVSSVPCRSCPPMVGPSVSLSSWPSLPSPAGSASPSAAPSSASGCPSAVSLRAHAFVPRLSFSRTSTRHPLAVLSLPVCACLLGHRPAFQLNLFFAQVWPILCSCDGYLLLYVRRFGQVLYDCDVHPFPAQFEHGSVSFDPAHSSILLDCRVPDSRSAPFWCPAVYSGYCVSHAPRAPSPPRCLNADEYPQFPILFASTLPCRRSLPRICPRCRGPCSSTSRWSLPCCRRLWRAGVVCSCLLPSCPAVVLASLRSAYAPVPPPLRCLPLVTYRNAVPAYFLLV